MFDLDRWYRSGGVSPVLVAAEIGINHGGDFDLARRLVDSAAGCGADAVKFQVFRTADFYNPKLAKGAFDLFRGFELPDEKYAQLKKHAEDLGLVFFATPLDPGSLRFLSDIGTPILKVASSDITTEPFLAEIAELCRKKGHYAVLSTGFVRLPEVRKAVKLFRGTKAALLYCVSRYPASAADGDFDLRYIDTLAAAFRLPVGFSDHSLNTVLSLGAVARGARMIERHFTLSRNTPGADHSMSLEPSQFSELVKGVRELEAALGDGSRVLTDFEKEIAPLAMRDIYATREIRKGDTIQAADLAMLRPGKGVEAGRWRSLIGKRSDRNIGVYEKI